MRLLSLGRGLPPLLAVLSAAGLLAAAPQGVTPTIVPPAHQQYIKIPPPVRQISARLQAEINKLKGFIESGEKALEEKDWDSAAAWAEQADELVADWPDETLRSGSPPWNSTCPTPRNCRRCRIPASRRPRWCRSPPRTCAANWSR